jgi:hypothetical protein
MASKKKIQNRTCTKKHNKAKQNDERRSKAHEENLSNCPRHKHKNDERRSKAHKEKLI